MHLQIQLGATASVTNTLKPRVVLDAAVFCRDELQEQGSSPSQAPTAPRRAPAIFCTHRSKLRARAVNIFNGTPKIKNLAGSGPYWQTLPGFGEVRLSWPCFCAGCLPLSAFRDELIDVVPRAGVNSRIHQRRARSDAHQERADRRSKR